MSIEDPRIMMLFVPRHKIQPALVDLHYTPRYGSAFRAYVKCADYLKDENLFAVQVVCFGSYPFLEEQWKEKWQ